MHWQKWLLIGINIFGGFAVLGSYVFGFRARPGAANILWGGVPEDLRPYYTIGMFLAAVGYFAFSYFILFRLKPGNTRIYSRFGYGLFPILYTAILLPSALWMPLTFLAFEQDSDLLAWAVRIVLAVVGLTSLGLLAAISGVEPKKPAWSHKLAITGIIGFCIQTALLDAIVWSAYFQP